MSQECPSTRTSLRHPGAPKSRASEGAASYRTTQNMYTPAQHGVASESRRNCAEAGDSLVGAMSARPRPGAPRTFPEWPKPRAYVSRRRVVLQDAPGRGCVVVRWRNRENGCQGQQSAYGCRSGLEDVVVRGDCVRGSPESCRTAEHAERRLCRCEIAKSRAALSAAPKPAVGAESSLRLLAGVLECRNRKRGVQSVA